MAAPTKRTAVEKVMSIPLTDLYSNPNHPVKMREDDSFRETIQSVIERGVLVPSIVRPREGGGYEIIDGRRRKAASELAELPTMPCIIRELDDDAATITMVDSCIQRDEILPCERAAAYKMKLEAIKRQGERTDLTSRQVGGRSEEAADVVGQETGDNFDIKELGKQLKKIGMLIVQDAVWNRVTINREARKSTRYYIDEFHLLLKEEQTAAYSVEIWKRFRKWGGIPTGITQNVKDLLSSREVENIFENSDYVYMLNQASGDRQILAKQLNISPHQLSYVTHSGEGEGLLFYGSVILPFVDRFPKDTELYRAMTTKLSDLSA